MHSRRGCDPPTHLPSSLRPSPPPPPPLRAVLEQFKHTLTGEYPAQLASDIVEGVKNIP